MLRGSTFKGCLFLLCSICMGARFVVIYVQEFLAVCETYKTVLATAISVTVGNLLH